MRKSRAQAEYQPRPVGPDGELLLDKFCAYCGALNAEAASYCQHCREYILDQGPDLTNRLARISRRASGGKSQYRPLFVRTIEAQFLYFDSFVTGLENGGRSLLVILCWPLIQCAKLSLVTIKLLLNAFGWMMLGTTLYDLTNDPPKPETRIRSESPVISAEDRSRTQLALAYRLARVRERLANVDEYLPEEDISRSSGVEPERQPANSLFGVLLRLADDIPGWLWFVFLWFVVLVLWLVILALR